MRATPYLYKKLVTHEWLFPLVKRLSTKRIKVINYHNIAPGLEITPEAFAEQAALVASQYQTFYASEVPLLMAGRLRPKRPPLVLTFDDGFENNSKYAFERMEQLGLKGTLFLPTGVMQQQERYLWNHEVRIRLENTSETHLNAVCERFGVPHQDKWERIHWCCEHLKKLQQQQRNDEIYWLEQRIPEFKPTPEQVDKYRLMTLEDAKALPDCIEIGSHTVNHKILTTIPMDQVEYELQQSKAYLEEYFRRPIETFCYPNGNWNENIRELVARFYQAGFSTEEGLVQDQDNLHSLKRIPAYADFSLFKFALIRPYKNYGAK